MGDPDFTCYFDVESNAQGHPTEINLLLYRNSNTFHDPVGCGSFILPSFKSTKEFITEGGQFYVPLSEKAAANLDRTELFKEKVTGIYREPHQGTPFEEFQQIARQFLKEHLDGTNLELVCIDRRPPSDALTRKEAKKRMNTDVENWYRWHVRQILSRNIGDVLTPGTLQDLRRAQAWIESVHDQQQLEVTQNETDYTSDDIDEPAETSVTSYDELAEISSDDQPDQVGGATASNQPLYEVIRESSKHIKKYNATGYSQTIRVTPPENIEDWMGFVTDVFDEICNEKLADLDDNDFIRAVLDCEGMRNPVSTTLMRKQDFSADYLLTVFEQVLQSNDDVDLSEPFTIYFTTVKQPKGGKSPWVVRHTLTAEEARNKLKCIVQVHVEQNLCLPAAIFLGDLMLRNGRQSHVFVNVRRKDRRKVLARHAKELYRQAMGREHNGEQCSLEDLAQFQRYFFDNFQIIVFQWNPREIIWRGQANPGLDLHRKVFLFYDRQFQHFDMINSPAPFLRKSMFCLQCLKGYDDARQHTCLQNCKGCFRANCPDKDKDDGVPCTLCNRIFPGPSCYSAHFDGSAAQPISLCDRYKKCFECGHTIKTRETHTCRKYWCISCKEKVEYGHQCFIKPVAKPGANEGHDADSLDTAMIGENPNQHINEQEEQDFVERRYVYFDVEAYPDEKNGGRHVCNLIVAQDNHGNEFVFKPPLDPVDTFCQWALNPGKNANTTFIAHNSKRYDSYFIMSWILQNCHERTEQIVYGGQLLLLDVKDLKVRFIDSISFLASSLAKLPALVGLNGDVEKGFFPHVFNRPENYGYSGTMPPVDVYEPEQMTEGRRTEFLDWYNQRIEENYVFSFWEELTRYCRKDVEVLRLCCERFRQIFFQETTVDPFQSVTIASACNLVYRKCFLDVNAIAIVPPQGYAGRDKQSHQAILWLMWRQHQNNGMPMRHARNGREVIVPLGGDRFYRIDGVWLNDDGTETKSGLEFLGCFFHGCPICYHPKLWNPMLRKTMGTLHGEFLIREKALREAGWEIEYKWGCSWSKDLKEDDEVCEFVLQEKENAEQLGTVNFIEPLNPRDAFFGGRTNAACLYYKLEPGSEEKIRYIDVNSLYPYVNKWRAWPVGHPEILVGPAAREDKIDDYFGIAKCLVLPPKRLFHPILPMRFNKKLMFVLCKTCALEGNTNYCRHQDSDRALYGTWVTEEIKLALRNGYQLIRLDEVWHFPNKSESLFADYINKFLKMKQQARGWPSHIDTNDDDAKEKYLADYFHAEGVNLDPNSIVKNPGLYQVAKICLNSFWGKFGQRLNLGKLKLIRSEEEFWQFLLADNVIISELLFHGEEVAQIEYKDENAFVLPGLNTNVVIAAVTTAYARIHLWNTLGPLQERALYYDTDSIIMIDRPGEPMPTTGEYLGEFKDELEGANGKEDWIVEFMSGGPKNYGYVTAKGKTCLKVRGFTLNQIASQTLTLGVVRQMIHSIDVEHEDENLVVVNMGTTIKRDKRTWRLTTADNVKRYRLVYQKRIICADGRNTVPFGYCESS